MSWLAIAKESDMVRGGEGAGIAEGEVEMRREDIAAAGAASAGSPAWTEGAAEAAISTSSVSPAI
jgi:hypothetical protein